MAGNPADSTPTPVITSRPRPTVPALEVPRIAASRAPLQACLSRVRPVPHVLTPARPDTVRAVLEPLLGTDSGE